MPLRKALLALCATVASPASSSVHPEPQSMQVSLDEPSQLQVCLCMWYDGKAISYGKHSEAINRAVAAANSFRFFFSNTTYFKDRAASWQKLGLVQSLLKRDDCSHVVWIDADAAFVPGGGKMLVDLILRELDSPIIFGMNTPESRGINAGLTVYKATDATRGFVAAVTALQAPAECIGVDGMATYFPHASFFGGFEQFGSVDELCEAFTQRRQWEQECVSAMLFSPCFADLRLVTKIDEGLERKINGCDAGPARQEGCGALVAPSCPWNEAELLQWPMDRPFFHWSGPRCSKAVESSSHGMPGIHQPLRTLGLEALRRLHGL